VLICLGDPWLDSPFQVFRTSCTWVSFLFWKVPSNMRWWYEGMCICSNLNGKSRANYLGLNPRYSFHIFFLIVSCLCFFLLAACRIWSAALWFSFHISREYQLWDVYSEFLIYESLPRSHFSETNFSFRFYILALYNLIECGDTWRIYL